MAHKLAPTHSTHATHATLSKLTEVEATGIHVRYLILLILVNPSAMRNMSNSNDTTLLQKTLLCLFIATMASVSVWAAVKPAKGHNMRACHAIMPGCV
jgi:quinol-cytochrome oxidoreductase complex cytochrome b subunit